MTEEDKMREVLRRYANGECSETEKEIIDRWYASLGQTGEPLPNTEERATDLSIVWAEVKPKGTRQLYRLVGYAAAILIGIGVSAVVWLHRHRDGAGHPVAVTVAKDILPGSDKATLTLSDGRSISLNEISIGFIGSDEGGSVTKNEEGSLYYDDSRIAPDAPAAYHTLKTPRGGQFRLSLPDGSRVWLNASSSLSYAANKFGLERTVKLTGEGYFEITPNPEKPFKVFTDGQEVTVLGTKFNVNCYDDEPGTRTTLVEGAVNVRVGEQGNPVRLRPGQQAFVVKSDAPKVSTVDVGTAIAWTKGMFKFDGNSIDEVMRQLARWYDFEVELQGKLPDTKLYGEANRNATADTPLELLSFFHFDYKMSKKDEHTIITIINN